MTLDTYLAALPGRCVHGYHPKQRHSCTQIPSSAPASAVADRSATGQPWASNVPSASAGEWPLFVSVLRKVARDNGMVHQGDVRPLVRGRIPAKHIGQLWKRARNDGLIVDTGEWERSTDVEGRNGDKQCRIYRLATRGEVTHMRSDTTWG